MERRKFYEPKLDPKADPAYLADREAYKETQPIEVMSSNRDFDHEPNLIGSLVEGKLGQSGAVHMPVFDVDGIPVRIVQSATPGNCHVYIDKPVTWESYTLLLSALVSCGIIEPGYAQASFAQGATFVRVPGVPKV